MRPLTPSDADLQDFPFMPLHVARLRDSDLAAEEHPEACWYAVLLWAASWHQLPAGSLPNNDMVLARLANLGRDQRTWKKHREAALRGFVTCSDGRLYHPVVAEQVISAWDQKLRQRHRTLCATIRKHNERYPDDKRDSPSFDQWSSLGCPENIPDLVTSMSRVTDAKSERDKGSKGQGQREGQGDSNTEADASGGARPPDPDKVMFDSGRRLLMDAGKSKDQAGKLLGQWRGRYGTEPVIAALGRAQREGAIDPVSFITACLGVHHGKRDRAGEQGELLNPMAAAAARSIARHAGGG